MIPNPFVKVLEQSRSLVIKNCRLISRRLANESWKANVCCVTVKDWTVSDAKERMIIDSGIIGTNYYIVVVLAS
jgi:hypothetical protein